METIYSIETSVKAGHAAKLLKKEDTVTTTHVYVRIWGKYITTATTKAAVSPITTHLNT
jgi:hypothetical protein